MKQLYAILLHFSSVGNIIAIADDTAVILLKFIKEKDIESIILMYQKSFNNNVQKEPNAILLQLKQELEAYFNGTLQKFCVPYKILHGSDFQQKTWQTLCSISYGETRSYKEVARKINNPLAMRAVGSANGANPILILIPCHRVINADKKLGGYAGGVEIKQWLLNHETKIITDKKI